MTAAHYLELLDYGLSKPKVSFDRADRNPATRIRARAATLGFFVGHLPDFALHAVFQHAHIAPSQLARITMTRFANSKSVARRVAKIEQENGPRPHSHRAISPVVIWRRNLAAQYKVQSATDAGRAVTGFTIPFVWHAGIGVPIAMLSGSFPSAGLFTWSFAIWGGLSRWGVPYVMDYPWAHKLVHHVEGKFHGLMRSLGGKTKALGQWSKDVRYKGRHRPTLMRTTTTGKHRALSTTKINRSAHDHQAHEELATAHRHDHVDRHEHSCAGRERRHMTIAEAESVLMLAVGACPRFGNPAHAPWKKAAVSIKTLMRGVPNRFEIIPEAGSRVKLAYDLADVIEVNGSVGNKPPQVDLSVFDEGVRSCVSTLLDPAFKSALNESRYRTPEPSLA